MQKSQLICALAVSGAVLVLQGCGGGGSGSCTLSSKGGIKDFDLTVSGLPESCCSIVTTAVGCTQGQDSPAKVQQCLAEKEKEMETEQQKCNEDGRKLKEVNLDAELKVSGTDCSSDACVECDATAPGGAEQGKVKVNVFGVKGCCEDVAKLCRTLDPQHFQPSEACQLQLLSKDACIKASFSATNPNPPGINTTGHIQAIVSAMYTKQQALLGSETKAKQVVV